MAVALVCLPFCWHKLYTSEQTASAWYILLITTSCQKKHLQDGKVVLRVMRRGIGMQQSSYRWTISHPLISLIFLLRVFLFWAFSYINLFINSYALESIASCRRERQLWTSSTPKTELQMMPCISEAFLCEAVPIIPSESWPKWYVPC